MLIALQAGVEDQQPDAVFGQEVTHLFHVGVLHFGRRANELIQTSGGFIEGGRPEQLHQQALEALGTLPVTLGLVASNYEVLAFLLFCI